MKRTTKKDNREKSTERNSMERNSRGKDGTEREELEIDKEELRFVDSLPEDILKELTPEVRRQYFFWDEVTKREVQLYPRLILPIIEEVFGKTYSDDEKIILLSTEYTVSRIHEKGESLLHSIRSDLLLKIGDDRYHFECQIEKDGNMVFRMLEYDIHIALTHGITVEKNGRKKEFTITFPKSTVLYLGDEKSVPEYETCTIYFQDGGSYQYRVPVMKVQEYSLEELEGKHLIMLIPFLPIRFRKQIKDAVARKGEKMSPLKKERQRILKRDLTEFLSECIMVVNREKEKGILSERMGKDIVEFLYKACGYLLEEDEELMREVSEVMEPAIKMSWEVIAELEEDNRELQEDNKELKDNIINLRQERENGYRNLIKRQKKEGKSEKETADALMEIFSLTMETAEETVQLYWSEK